MLDAVVCGAFEEVPVAVTVAVGVNDPVDGVNDWLGRGVDVAFAVPFGSSVAVAR